MSAENMGNDPANPDSDRAEKLTRRIDALLREQPLRSAPVALPIRVMAAIERRQQRGWQSGFKRWPLAAQITFIALSGVMAKLAVDLSMWLVQSVSATVAVPRPPLAAALAETLLTLSKHLPPLWLYGAIAMLVLVYGGLFGISTAVYRTLYVPR